MPSIRHLISAALSDRRTGDLFARVQAAAHDAATSPYSRDQPTVAQLEANSYRTGRVDIQGLPVRIENPRGTRREKPGRWSNLMLHHYGDIAGTKGNDGDPVDVFIGPFPELSVVYVVNQVGREGAFDEHKVCIGFQSEADARAAYLSAYAPGWDGLDSIVRATVTQLKWWLKFGDKSRPFTPAVLPYEGQTTMDKVLWNPQAEPVTMPLHTLMYELRTEDADAGLMLDAVTLAELMTDPDIQAMPVLDAMVVEVGRLQTKMEALQRIMAAAGGTVKPTEVSISDPVRYRGVAQVMVVFSMDDGQTVSVWFHNPDTTPAKLMPLDELISWKWMLNKKDVTIVVAPEKGRDLNPREVARRMMRLVERNTEAFKKANARTAERAAQLQSLDTEIASLEVELSDLNRQIEVAKVEAEDRKASEPHYSDLTLQALIDNHGWKAAYFDGPGDSGKVVSVAREFVGVGPLGTTITPDGMRRLSAGYGKDRARRRYIELSLGDTVIGDWDGRDQDPAAVAALVNEAAEKFVNEKRAKNGLPPLGEEKPEPAEVPAASYDDFLAAVVVALGEKAGINATEAAKLARDSNRTDDGFADKVPADQVADQILADNKRSPNVERAYAIAEVLISQYGWSKSLDNDMPKMGINLESPRDAERWVYLGEERGMLDWDAIKSIHEMVQFGGGEAFAALQNAEIAMGFDRADFSVELSVDDDGMVPSGEEFEGKTPEFAYAAEVLSKGATAAGAMVQFGDFNGSTAASMFDKATNPTPYADVSVYGITAQIGVGGKVLARASIDEDGKITILKGTGGTEEVGTPADAGDVRELVKMLMAEEAAKPGEELEPAPTPTPDDAGDTTQATDVNGGEGEEVPEGEDPIAAVDAAYKFDDATDEFKRWVAESIAETDYSPFASSKVIDEAAKKHGARVSWDIQRVMDSIIGEVDADDLPDGFILDGAYTDQDKKAVAATVSLLKYLREFIRSDKELAHNPMMEKFGFTSDAIINKDQAQQMLTKLVDVAISRKGGEADLTSEELQRLQDFQHDARVIDDYFEKRIRNSGSRNMLRTPEMKKRYPEIDNPDDFDNYAKRGGRDAAVMDDATAAKRITVADDTPMKDRPFGAKQVAFVNWGTGGGTMLVEMPKEDRKMFGGGTFVAPAGEMPGGARVVRLDPKAMTMEVAQKSGDELTWTAPVKVKSVKVYNLAKFTSSYRVATMDSVDQGDAILDAAEGWDSIVGTIRKGAKIVGRAHVGGDGKAMVFVGKSGNTRVKFKSSVDGDIRDALWSDDDAPLMVDWLFTEPANGIEKPANDKPEQLSREAIIPAVKYLSDFIGRQQLDTMTSAVRGEEGQWFIDKLVTLADQIKGMPGVHGQDGKGNNAIAYLHYFNGGQDWYITERDMDGEQLQAFGFADFGASSDLGYINIQELIEKNVELDLHWKPKTLAEIRGQAPDSADDGETGEAPAVNPDAELPQAMIDGTVNLMDETLADKLEPLFVKYENDPAMMDLLNRAVAAYSDAVVSAAKAALAG